ARSATPFHCKFLRNPEMERRCCKTLQTRVFSSKTRVAEGFLQRAAAKMQRKVNGNANPVRRTACVGEWRAGGVAGEAAVPPRAGRLGRGVGRRRRSVNGGSLAAGDPRWSVAEFFPELVFGPFLGSRVVRLVQVVQQFLLGGQADQEPADHVPGGLVRP